MVQEKSRGENPLISVVLPVFNEAQTLPLLFDRVRAVMADEGLRYELVFVNDGSTDDSQAVMEGLCSESCKITSLRLSRNFGHQKAIVAGLEH